MFFDLHLEALKTERSAFRAFDIINRLNFKKATDAEGAMVAAYLCFDIYLAGSEVFV